jgi:hypothetical protein
MQWWPAALKTSVLAHPAASAGHAEHAADLAVDLTWAFLSQQWQAPVHWPLQHKSS